MRMRFPRRVAAGLVLALAVSLMPAVAFAAPSVSVERPQGAAKASRPQRLRPLASVPLAADDDIPGVALPASPVSGTLNASSDIDDVFAVTLGAGETLVASISGPANIYFDLWLYNTDAASLGDPSITTSDAMDRDFSYPHTLVFKADPALGYGAGTYYLDAFAGVGSGTYTITWRIVPDDSDDDIPGVPIPTSPFTRFNTGVYEFSDDGISSAPIDMYDVFAVDLAEGERLTFSGARASGATLSLELFVYPSTATNVDKDGEVYQNDAWVASTDLLSGTMPESLTYVVPPGGAGTYYIDVEAWEGTGDYTLTWKVDQASVVRLSGGTRFDTSQAIVRSTSLESTTAILANGYGYADALSASGLAGAYDAPLMLTDRYYVPGSVLVHLVAMGVTDIKLVGGTSVIDPDVASILTASGFTVERISGTDRYATSKACADKVLAVQGSVPGAFVVRGDAFADALAVSPLAYTRGMPVLLTTPTRLSAPAAAFLESNDVTQVVVAGGTSAVSSPVASAIAALNGSTTVVTRKAGVNRYGTARMVGEYGVEQGWSSWGYVGVATGLNFPDALAGGIGSGRMGGVLLLTDPKVLSPDCKNAIVANVADIDRVAIFGGTGAVSASVANAIDALVP
ncbi:MAG: cell wall-binding repeat-containing protein [Coriobacteriia bacterium]